MPDTSRLTTIETDRLRRAGGCAPACVIRATASRTWQDGACYAVVTGTHNGDPFTVEGGPQALKDAVGATFTHGEGT